MQKSTNTNNAFLYYFTYNTEIGEIFIASDGSAITAMKFGHRAAMNEKKEANALTDQAAMQLEEYLIGKRRQFDIPINPHGTEFQRSVWNALLAIPYGETRSYRQIAHAIGNPSACRAVGMANSKNPISIIIPCHRVIGESGSLVGYGGGLELKMKLLTLERNAQIRQSEV